MKGLFLHRNSFEHIAEVAKIDNHFNSEVSEAAKEFKKTGVGIELEGNPRWIVILTEIEERRMEEHRSMKARVIDPPRC